MTWTAPRDNRTAVDSSALIAIPQLYDWVSAVRPAGVRKRPLMSTGRPGPIEGRKSLPGGSNTVIVREAFALPDASASPLGCCAGPAAYDKVAPATCASRMAIQ